MKFITFYLYIISELQFYISFNILLDNEVMETSKRRSFLPLIFIIKDNDISLEFWTTIYITMISNYIRVPCRPPTNALILLLLKQRDPLIMLTVTL